MSELQDIIARLSAHERRIAALESRNISEILSNQAQLNAIKYPTTDEAAAQDIQNFYGGKAPLPEGVTPYDPVEDPDD